jgi:hypothetical protein
MTQSQYITNVSPERETIVSMLEKRAYTTREVADTFGWSRERTYNILNQLHRSSLIGRTGTEKSVLWGKYKKPPAPPKKAKPFLNGTTKQRLSLSYMASPYRAGAQDAYQIGSHS